MNVSCSKCRERILCDECRVEITNQTRYPQPGGSTLCVNCHLDAHTIKISFG